MREHTYRKGSPIGHGRDPNGPWFDHEQCSPHLFNDSAGLHVWEASPRMKGNVTDLEYLKDRPNAFSGVRHYSNHPMANAVVDQIVFNHSLQDDFCRSQHYFEDPELSHMRDGAAGQGGMASKTRGVKQFHSVKYNGPQADRVIFCHETYERPDEHPEVMFGSCGVLAAGSRSWRCSGGLANTLQDTVSLDGYVRQGKKPKPPSEAGSAPSHTHEVRGRKHPFDPCPTYHSVINAAAFNRSSKSRSPSPQQKECGKPRLVWSSRTFQGLMSGRAGMASNDLGRSTLRSSNKVVTKDDALSQCSTAYSGAASEGAHSMRSMRSSQSQPVLKSRYGHTDTSNAIYGKHIRSSTPRPGSPRSPRSPRW